MGLIPSHHTHEDPDKELLRFFNYRHLPSELQGISKEFGELAWAMVAALPPSHQKTMALEHLLIAKDAAVRSVIPIKDTI